MIDRQMDGIILVGPRMQREAIEAAASRIPMAVIAPSRRDRCLTSTPSTMTISWGRRLVVQHLAARRLPQHRHAEPGAARRTNRRRSPTQREIGYRAAMRRSRAAGATSRSCRPSRRRAISRARRGSCCAAAQPAGGDLLLDRLHRPRSAERRARTRASTCRATWRWSATTTPGTATSRRTRSPASTSPARCSACRRRAC